MMSFPWQILHLLAIGCFVALHATKDSERLPRIGIIGAGIGGTSSAYFLRQLFGDDLDIDIIEANRVGGRTGLIDVGGHQYEAGAIIIHGKNRYMRHFNDLFRKNDQTYIRRGATHFGLHGSDGIMFRSSEWTAVTWAKILWRYGLDLFTLQKWIANEIFPRFERIYTLQENGMAFTSCESLLGALSEDFVKMAKTSIEEVMSDLGISRRFIEELGAAVMRNNYGQTLQNVHGFVGSVSLAGMDSGLWSVNGGNVNIPEYLFKESKATLIKGRVTSVALVKGDHSTYTVNYVKQDDGAELTEKKKEYDIVIIATPLNGTKTKFSFADFPSPVVDFKQDYHTTVTMFVQGKINKTTFNLEDENDFPHELFTVDKDSSFDYIERQVPAKLSGKSTSSIWEIFLNRIPTDEDINELFESHEDVKVIDWFAYPEYAPNMDLPPFVLNERLYYINAIESAASALEMVAVGAKNVALLAFNQWKGHLDKIDEKNITPDIKAQTEL